MLASVQIRCCAGCREYIAHNSHIELFILEHLPLHILEIIFLIYVNRWSPCFRSVFEELLFTTKLFINIQ